MAFYERRMTAALMRKNIVSRQRFILIAKEIFRKSIHLCSAFIPLLLKYMYVPVLASLSLVTVIYIACEYAHFKGRHIPVISTITAAAARKRDENKFVLGPVTLSMGIIICSLMWEPLPAAIGVYALAFGDGLASLAGKLFGKIRIPLTEGKTAAGSLTCFSAIFISAFLTGGDAGVALIVASAGMFIEVLPLKDFDNLIIPVALGGLAQLCL